MEVGRKFSDLQYRKKCSNTSRMHSERVRVRFNSIHAYVTRMSHIDTTFRFHIRQWLILFTKVAPLQNKYKKEASLSAEQIQKRSVAVKTMDIVQLEWYRSAGASIDSGQWHQAPHNHLHLTFSCQFAP